MAYSHCVRVLWRVQDINSRIELRVLCESEEAAKYTREMNEPFITDAVEDCAFIPLQTSRTEKVDRRLVCLRCPAPQLLVRLSYHGDDVAEHEAFMACNPSVIKLMTAATFTKGLRGFVDIQMQIESDGSIIASEMLFQVIAFNKKQESPGKVGGEAATSYLQIAPRGTQCVRKADVTYWPAQDYANVHKVTAARSRGVSNGHSLEPSLKLRVTECTGVSYSAPLAPRDCQAGGSRA